MASPTEPRGPGPNVTGNVYDGDQLMTIEEVAHFLNIPVGTIRKQRVEGKFAAALKIGKHLRWKRSTLLAWLEERADED